MPAFIRRQQLLTKIIQGALCLGLCSPALALAQSNNSDSQITELDLITTTSGTSSTTTVVLVDIFICPPIRSACEVLSTTSELSWMTSLQSQQTAMVVFLRENSVALSQDIATGGGQTLRDLAVMYGLKPEQAQSLGLSLRPRREQLWAILSKADAIGVEEVAAFNLQVAQALGLVAQR